MPKLLPIWSTLLIFMTSGIPTSAAELSASFVEKALAAMKSSDERKRKAAYRTFQHLGKESMAGYQKVLHKAQLHHQGAMRRTMSVRANPYIAHADLMDELKAERERVTELIRTDWQKKPSKVRMLENDLKGVGRKSDRLVKLVGSNTESIDKSIKTAFQALVEIAWELSSIERSEDGENTDEVPDKKDLEEVVYEDCFEAEQWREQLRTWKITKDAITQLEESVKHNADCKWANKSQRDFSNYLNEQRFIMGLRPLLLDEILSNAAKGHSDDMRSAGFFSHTSPIEGKKTPADRARKAQFKGRWTGENIYMGSSSFMAAYNGWFASDGHRFLLFTQGASNVIGLGISGGHWTMMTGQQ